MDKAKFIEDKKLENAKKMKEWKHPRCENILRS